MSIEAILSIKAVEEKAKAKKQEAVAEAKRAVAAARQQGAQKIAEAVSRAEAEIKDMTAKADDIARASVTETAAQNENRKAALLAKGNAKLEKAAELIVERIVNS